MADRGTGPGGWIGRAEKGAKYLAAKYLAAQHARLSSRRGRTRAQMAVGRSLLVSAYWMLTQAW